MRYNIFSQLVAFSPLTFVRIWGLSEVGELNTKWCLHWCVLSHFSNVRLFVTLWTVAHQAPLSMGFSRQEYWSGLPCCPPGDLPNPGTEPRSPTLQNSLPSEPPGKPKNTGVGSLSLLQGNFPNQESNWGLLHCRQILYQLSYKGSPRILEWVAYPFSKGSSQPMNWTGVSCIAGGFFTSWAIREAPSLL